MVAYRCFLNQPYCNFHMMQELKLILLIWQDKDVSYTKCFFFKKWWHTSNNTFYHASIYLKNQALEKQKNKTKHQNGHSWPCHWVSAWHSAASPSGLGENNRKRHTRTEKAPGKETKNSLTHTVALLRHVKNVVQLETSSLTGCDFHDWANQYHKQDSNNGCNQLT